MPKMSVIIPAFNVSRYIENCVDSVRRQTLSDIEIIVVDDASEDETPQILSKLASLDSRINVVTHSENKGRHLARKTGVKYAVGEYTVFLDGDDEFEETFCESISRKMDESGTDILHFGITVTGENGVSENTAQSFASYINRSTQKATGAEIERLIFQESYGYAIDWRTTQRVYRTTLAKKAFLAMCSTRLDRAEDCYETYVLSHLATNACGFEECRGLIYHYGRGVTGTSSISADAFATFVEQFKQCVDACRRYTDANPELEDCFEGMRRKLMELLANEWDVRVSSNEKRGAASSFVTTFGTLIADREFYRVVRDRAYDCIASSTVPDDSDELYEIARIAAACYTAEGLPAELWRCNKMKRIADSHLQQLEISRRFADYENQDIRIFVATHKPASYFDSSILQPIQVGTEQAAYRLSDTYHDDEGDNISSQNALYCELTAQYWAWKNTRAEYVGFCHYRRYFNFSPIRYKENKWGEVIDDRINEQTRQKYGLDDESIRKSVEGYDVITTEIKNLRMFPGAGKTPFMQWAAAPALHDKDLINALAILEELYPEYSADVEAFINGNTACFCNMYIMRKTIFDDYCAWLFPILQKFVETTDMSDYSRESLRTPGHLSERLFNIYYLHHMKSGNGWKTKQVQCVHFTHTDPSVAIQPLSLIKEIKKPVIPVVFAADTNYVPMVATTIYSMLKNASMSYHYDIYIFSNKPNWLEFGKLEKFINGFENATVRTIDISDHISGYDLVTSNAHISIETYYRFLVQDVLHFYDKVIYLDSDLIIKADISALYRTDISNNLVAAVRDLDFAGNINMKNGKRRQYAAAVLGMRNPFDYFQAGVLVLNTKNLRETVPTGVWLEESTDSKYIYNDQDILNKYCEGKVEFLDDAWNVMTDCAARITRVFSFAPAEEYHAFLDARTREKIIHYAGFEKPWTTRKCDRREEYWAYARETPFYEDLIIRLMENEIGKPADGKNDGRVLAEENPLRRVIDPLMPIGSRRREAAKALIRDMRP